MGCQPGRPDAILAEFHTLNLMLAYMWSIGNYLKWNFLHALKRFVNWWIILFCLFIQIGWRKLGEEKVTRHIVVVISPLLSLIKAQQKYLNDLGVLTAAALPDMQDEVYTCKPHRSMCFFVGLLLGLQLNMRGKLSLHTWMNFLYIKHISVFLIFIC